MQSHDQVRAVEWAGDRLRLLDQRKLPESVEYVELTCCEAVAKAITDMVVRGAPAIGITAAYGVVLAAKARYAESPEDWRRALETDLKLLANARPTAVNLRWALARMRARMDALACDPIGALSAEAKQIQAQDIAANYRMGQLGAALLDGKPVLTHCNTGSLATGGYGTALGVIRSAFKAGRLERVYADETRPWLQGSRLTAWELVQDQIPVTLICDGAASSLLRAGTIGWVIVGADRIAANGDVANKIGTYNLAVSARYHGVDFMVVAPTSTIDLSTACGADITIENRDTGEVLSSRALRDKGATAWNPVFDVTPAELVDVLVTERGIVHRPNAAKLVALIKNGATAAPLRDS
jgi:methylthioribose-1-phosphate isomerase